MHFMNPVPVMKLVELIRGMQTSDEVRFHCSKAFDKKRKREVYAFQRS